MPRDGGHRTTEKDSDGMRCILFEVRRTRFGGGGTHGELFQFPGRKGLWLDFAHHHLGLTLGPVSGRLLAEIVHGESPFADPAPFRAERFG